ncbi:MAG: DUF484 family protein, partial [Mariprofundaceae bacterium]
MTEPADKSGAKVQDLSARRMQKMAEENRQLREYVADVMLRLRENEHLFSKLFELESQVLAATDPEDLCFTLLRSLRSSFSLDMVRFWFDQSSFIGNCHMEGLSERDLIWLEKGEIEGMGLKNNRVCLMRLTQDKNFDWMSKQDESLASMALLLLGDSQRPFGVLGIGSVDAERFAPEHDTDFLQHLAQVIGLSLENSVSSERLARLSITDALTGSHNRRFLQPHSHQPLSQWFGKDTCVAALYFDLDGFKGINDRLGHTVGDDLLVQVCDCTRQFIRNQDPLIRMGGDEFVVLLPGCSRDKAGEIAKRIVQASAEIHAQDEKIAISMGIAFVASGQDMAVQDLIESADKAMYVAKA